MRIPLTIGVAAVVLASATTVHAQQIRYQAMDSDRDGIITRSEWRGTDRAFRNEDWNGDGVLSGDEVTLGARPQNWSQDWNRDGRVDNLDNQIAQRYRGYDMNSDNRVGRSEWPGDARLFAHLDTNRDGYLTIQEYTRGSGFVLDSQGGPSYRFSNLDMNNDGWVTRGEWYMGDSDFNRLDLNRDNRISRFEFENDTGTYNANRYTPAQFNTFDANRDGWITRAESRMPTGEFDRFDVNRDNRISRYEFDNIATVETTPEAQPSAAWRRGYDRGTQEGRAAGREDFVRRQGWDLEGQRELERADSGYTPQVGLLSDYQAGYREGFRNAYRTGFIEAGGRAPQ